MTYKHAGLLCSSVNYLKTIHFILDLRAEKKQDWLNFIIIVKQAKHTVVKTTPWLFVSAFTVAYCVFWSVSCRAHTSWPFFPGINRSKCPRWTAPAPGETRSLSPRRFCKGFARWPTAPWKGPQPEEPPKPRRGPKRTRMLSVSTAKAS